jgi:rfaE bifunctional protein kinase chain/domain
MSSKFIQELFEKISKLKVIVVGDVMVDNYIIGRADRLSPEAPVPVVNESKFESRLGGAGNVALNLKALGANAVLCSAIGVGKEGDHLVELLNAQDLSSLAIHRSEKRSTTTKTRVIANGAQIVRIDHEIADDMDTLDSFLLQQHFEREVEDADVVILQDYNKGVLHQENIEILIGIAHKANVPVVVDPKKANFLSFKNVDLFKPNLKEIKEGLNINSDLSTLEGVEIAINEMQVKLGNKISMVTMSERGVLVTGKNEKHHIAAHLRNISDVSGAGDTVISIAACCLAAGCSLKQLAELSNLGGGLVCEEKGVVPISKDRLISEAQRIGL